MKNQILSHKKKDKSYQWSCTKFIGPYSHKYLAVPNYLGTGSSSRWQHDFFMLKHSSSTNIHKISQKTQFFS